MSTRKGENNGGESRSFKILEVHMVKKEPSGGITRPDTQALLVDGDKETLNYVQQNMDRFVRNVIRVKQLEESDRRAIDENATLFEKNLEPLFDLLTSTSGSSLFSKMSLSLKKALIDMAFKRFGGNEEAVCDIFGLTHEQLHQEMETLDLPAKPKG